MFFLYVPEGIARNIISVKIKLHPKGKTIDRYMIKTGALWKISIASSYLENQIEYSYRLKLDKPGFFTYTSHIESESISIYAGINHRDIFSNPSIQGRSGNMKMGIVVHIQDILNEPKHNAESVLNEFNHLMSRNVRHLHCEYVFETLFSGHITAKLCLILFQSIQKNYVTREVLKKADIASKVWKELQKLDQEIRDFRGQYVQEIFWVYDATGMTQCSPLHYINDMQSLLDMSVLCNALIRNRCKTIHMCSKSSCLRRALESILNHDDESGKLKKLIEIIFDSIDENEVLEAYVILKELGVPAKNMEVKESAQKLVLNIIVKLLKDQVKALSFKKMNDIISKVEDDERSVIILHCEEEILANIRNSFQLLNLDSAWTFLEYLSKDETLFQTTDKQLLLLDAVSKMRPRKERRNFIKHILMKFQNTGSENGTETLKRAYDELFATIRDLPSSADLSLCFEEYDVLSEKMFFQKETEHFEERLKMHISKYSIIQLLDINENVENLHPKTINFYCTHLNEKLRYEQFSTIYELIQTYWKNVNTR